MELTRRVIFEKHLTFSNYESFYNTPDKLWEKAYRRMSCLYPSSYANGTFVGRLHYVVDKILSPALKNNTNYIIWQKQYNATTFQSVRKVVFNNAIGTYDIIEFKIYERRLDEVFGINSDFYDLKVFVCHLWQNREEKKRI